MGSCVRVVLLLVGLGLAPASARSAPPTTRTVPDAPYPDEFRARVEAEILRGSKDLLEGLGKSLDRPSPGGTGNAVGPGAVVLLTLLKCGIPVGDAVLEKGFARLRAEEPKQVYDTGVWLMALAARYDGGSDPFARDVVDAQGRHSVPARTMETLTPEDKACLEKGTAFLVKVQSPWKGPLAGLDLVGLPPGVPGPPGRPPPRGKEKKPPKSKKPATPAFEPEAPCAWGYPDGLAAGRSDWVDVSNTQYALLGLKAAAHCGVAVPDRAWAAALSALLAWQDDEGPAVTLAANEVRGAQRVEWEEAASARGYSYSGKPYKHGSVTGGRTTAGACGLLLCQSELWNSPRFPAEMQARTRTAIRDALAWMQANFDVDKNPGDNELAAALKGAKLPEGMKPLMIDPWYGCYLYGLERMGVMAHTRFLGRHDWYQEGAESILARRAKEHPVGDWDDCFDLLFLRRASFATAGPAITPGDTPLPVSEPPSPPGPSAPK